MRIVQVLNQNDYKLFKTIVGLKQNSLMKTLDSYLRRKYDKGKIIKTDAYIYAEGDIPIALVAHMDTVFKSPPEHIYYDERQGVIWSPEGLGADDRAGVFAILKIVQSGLRPTIIFTTDEEIGGVGAEKLVKDFPTSPSELKYIIQLDRRGTNDCVFYECVNEEFTKYVESFGFIENFGSFSDISELCPAWGIAGVNLSIGYEDEHSISETFHVKPWLSTVTKVELMLQEEEIPSFEYIEDTRYVNYWKALKNPYAWDYPDDDEICCSRCYKIFSEYEMIPVKFHHGIKYYCPDCCVDKVDWCNNCGEAFEAEKGEKFCPECRKKIMGENKDKCSTKKSKKNSIK